MRPKTKTNSWSGLANHRGQSLIEYLIIVAIVGIGSISLVTVIGQNLRSKLASISSALTGKQREYQVTPVERGHLSKKDLGNFMRGAGQ